MAAKSKPATSKPKKPTLALLPGKEANDVRALARLFEQITGRVVSKAEMKRAERLLNEPAPEKKK